jgi:hypothetical protein
VTTRAIAVAVAIAVGGFAGPSAGAPAAGGLLASTSTPAAPLTPSAAADALPPSPISITATGRNGVGRSDQPGLPCADGGDGASWHYGYEAPLAPGRFTTLPTDLRMNLDLHADGELPPLPAATPNGFLQGTESTVSLVNERGTVVLRLRDGGGCAGRTAQVGQSTGSAGGTWAVERGSGSYTSLTGTGTFSVNAGIAPGADNPWDLQLDGTVGVDRPALSASLVGLTWGPLGLDLLTRRPQVQIRITNNGADAYGLRLASAASTTPGVALLTGAPVDLGDLLAGESTVVSLRYQLALLGPCLAVLTLCQFDISLATSMTDALDRPTPEADAVRVRDDLLELVS